MKKRSLQFHELNYANLETHFWKPWRGCSMNIFLQMVEEIHNSKMKNLVMRIQVLGIIFMNFLELVMEVVVVVGMLVVTIGMDEDVVVVVMYTLDMMMRYIVILMMHLMRMKILLQIMEGLNITMIIVVVLPMMEDIIIIAIGIIRITLLESS
jgi:hypothetical protein